ncbi:winged helix-turn-helix domain-containing protein [Winogradskyella luteola]|uniref:Winged helix-turn-helix domain-containing protein n=1 Tax=Winogradskyella luteola TaxID=2828330 RepID=A0A9X1F948_9FLAO|nr:winged helix-turn-helix domain-containing protein [Winogradskyella luteola]MBV7268698.1 winged helix-turn-helix domain-containing protein [Winogradskyella luteola]
MANKKSDIIKIEDRVAKVLEILIKKSPNLVTRKELIEKVWQNYGGADDALNQAISNLRKLLNDDDKNNREIETVVKKGYRYKATIEQYDLKQNNKGKSKGLTTIILLIILSIIILFTIIVLSENTSIAPVAPK